MNEEHIQELDKLFETYNYNVSNKSNHKVRIYTLRYGMYHAAEILLLDKDYNPEKIKSEFSDLGYATEIKILNDISNIEEYLFEGFFIKTPLGNELKSRYKQFTNKQLKNLPEGSEYKYIKSSYEYLFQDENRIVVDKGSFNGDTEKPLIEQINSLLSETKGALFVILEAAAGFGKTCTAYEVLNTFSTESAKKLPFFTELSRNREARIFKHILLKEIDEQFPNGIKQNIVIEQIIKGRIPLIIDGFDELITKESNKEEVESMLTTIIDLLRGEAKIIITTRKTAIFNSDEFINSINEAKNDFSIARIEIKEPTIENWLSKERIKLLNSYSFPLEQVSNPVLLSYLRNIPIEKLTNYLINDDNKETLIDKYIDYLLKREQVRQNLKLNKNSQLKIFRKLIRLMTEFNITAETKDIIKEFIRDFNVSTLKKSIKEYIAEEKPSMEDLVETLSNHVFLDRKLNGDIGIINDFIFGFLVGENLILGEYSKHYENIHNILPQDFAYKAVQSFKIQDTERKIKLWDIFDKTPFQYDINFYFDLDYSYLGTFKREYLNLYVNDMTFNSVKFNDNAYFKESVFSNTTFKACTFNLNIFENCSFHNCDFYDCDFYGGDNKNFNDFSAFACTSNNQFVEKIYNRLKSNNNNRPLTEKVELSELFVLSQFFGIANLKPKVRKLSHIKNSLKDYSNRDISKVISSLKTKEFLYFQDDVGFISKAGINFFNQNKSSL